jgi:hypothetical protein
MRDFHKTKIHIMKNTSYNQTISIYKILILINNENQDFFLQKLSAKKEKQSQLVTAEK